MTSFSPGSAATDEVVYARQGRLGRVVLNRPKAINALTHAMVVSIRHQLDEWADVDDVEVVTIQGAGERGLCAGGDVRQLREALVNGAGDPAAFWADEYRLNATIAAYPKPIVAFMDGVTMGGGVGISAHASHRLATERSRIAMPETAIGFFPDVGGLYLLARSPGEWGTHLALTGLPADGPQAVRCGLADAVIASADIDGIVERLANGVSTETAWTPASDALAPNDMDLSWVDECYRGDDAAVILDALRSHVSPLARQSGMVLAGRSPLSVAVTLEALRRAASMSLTEVLEQDLRLGRAFAVKSDFVEGVRAVLVDRDNKPVWTHASLSDVDRSTVLSMFD
ncbi:enoyl-CoA hydratase/isomerase family protein [Stackebrandtia soli]|uniref:enoyl-CoA hydratase/isomerase family protein n=1 Tax=Stackebrandtia soli TaxID=1892856 RepID=UPI0039E800AF